MSRKASKKHAAFAREYVIDYNGKRAAIAAGYSASRAEVTASELVRNRKVIGLIDKLEEERAQRCQVDGDRVLEEVQRLAYSNMTNYITVKDGEAFVDLSTLTADKAAAIQEITVDEVAGGSGDGVKEHVKRTRFKLADKMRGLELLMRHKKLLTDKIELTGDEALFERLAAGRKRLQS